MNLKSNCKCGSNIDLEFPSSDRIWAEFRFKEWLAAHGVCLNVPIVPPTYTPTWKQEGKG